MPSAVSGIKEGECLSVLDIQGRHVVAALFYGVFDALALIVGECWGFRSFCECGVILGVPRNFAEQNCAEWCGERAGDKMGGGGRGVMVGECLSPPPKMFCFAVARTIHHSAANSVRGGTPNNCGVTLFAAEPPIIAEAL